MSDRFRYKHPKCPGFKDCEENGEPCVLVAECVPFLLQSHAEEGTVLLARNVGEMVPREQVLAAANRVNEFDADIDERPCQKKGCGDCIFGPVEDAAVCMRLYIFVSHLGIETKVTK